jgi:soluble lytic murein transglycosylase-like protein
MSRARVGILILLSLLLLLDGRVLADGAGASDMAAASREGTPGVTLARAGSLAAPDAARIVGRANPELAPQERDRIGAAVLRFGAKYGLDPELVLAVILVESGGRPWARSPKGAMGLMQVMPQQTARLGLRGNAATIESNVEAGCAILAENIERLGEGRGILAYFWGSDIRGDAYLQRVEAARAQVRRRLDS